MFAKRNSIMEQADGKEASKIIEWVNACNNESVGSPRAGKSVNELIQIILKTKRITAARKKRNSIRETNLIYFIAAARCRRIEFIALRSARSIHSIAWLRHVYVIYEW